MAPPPKTDSDQQNQSSVTSKRVLFARKCIEEKKMERLFEKARRSGIRAAREIHEPFSPIKPIVPLDFKIITETHPELANRF
tara:strand:+ start:2718 stop:2963 length:246 start_codon:yes stop_codon:yes gene_type:complete